GFARPVIVPDRLLRRLRRGLLTVTIRSLLGPLEHTNLVLVGPRQTHPVLLRWIPHGPKPDQRFVMRRWQRVGRAGGHQREPRPYVEGRAPGGHQPRNA